MTLEELNAKVREWDLRIGDPVAKFSTIFELLTYHAHNEWRNYIPATHPEFTQSYLERLAAWVGNVTEEKDQQLLLEYASYISFFSHMDFQALYTTAMHREVYRWVAEQIGAKLISHSSSQFHDAIKKEVHEKTWFCPITDSMDINEFYKANQLNGVGYRFGFAGLKKLVDLGATDISRSLKAYMDQPGANSGVPRPSLERIVLLEDIVGSATQCIKAVEWAAKELDRPILFIPLILCPSGLEELQKLESQLADRLTVRPIVELRRQDLLGPERKGAVGWPIASELEALVKKVSPSHKIGPNWTFGYKNTGCSVTTFSNTPDNTPPLVWYRSEYGWEPLFPRVQRGVE